MRSVRKRGIGRRCYVLVTITASPSTRSSISKRLLGLENCTVVNSTSFADPSEVGAVEVDADDGDGLHMMPTNKGKTTDRE